MSSEGNPGLILFIQMIITVIVILVVAYSEVVMASEFPERECCDPVYPVPAPGPAHPGHGGMAPAFPEYVASTPPATTEIPGVQPKTATAMMNCLQARDFCMENSACSPILAIVPRVCGSEKVACSTVTITKCQAALRTLQAFPYFSPICLCPTPTSDPACSTFRDYLFDHPCNTAKEKEKDPYPVDALPTCDHALDVCKKQPKCIQLYKDFKNHCRSSDNHCKMEDGELCHDAWSRLRFTPMFGCICPNNNNQRCDGIFFHVNSNPCVVQVISSAHSPDHEIESQLETPLLGNAAERALNRPPPFVPNYLTPSKTGHGHPQGPPSSHNQPGHSRGITTISSVRTYGSERGSLRISLHTTCYSSLQNCLRNPSCSTLLQAVLYWCDSSRCRQDTCMLALQGFYRQVETKWALEVAFCLCKKTENRNDQCLLAQQQLHPVCAQRSDQGANPPSCHYLAEECRSQPDCKARLEHFEQACAVDSVTRKCAGPSSECRLAILGILGTKLRTTCACNGTDVTHVYDCLGWQRILWFNPCVVDTQKDYIRQRAATTVSSTPRSTSTAGAAAMGAGHASTEFATTSTETVTGMDIVSTSFVNSYHSTEGTTSRTQGVTNLDYSTASSTSRGTTATEDFTTLSTTTSRPMITTTTAPPRYCVIRRPNQRDQKIIEGTSKRLYRDDEPSCSELCVCVPGEPPSCMALDCLDTPGCEGSTQKIPSSVTYGHTQPLYQAFRGHCMCYAGDFICAKPNDGTYTLYPGVFLFLGYSKKDENVLKPHTQLSAQDVVQALQQLISPQFHNQYVHHGGNGISKLRQLNGTSCRLDLFKAEGENLIINATLYEEDGANIPTRQTVSESFLIKEKVRKAFTHTQPH